MKLPDKLEKVLMSPFFLILETFFFFERNYKQIWKTFSTLAALGLLFYGVSGLLYRPRDLLIVCGGMAVAWPLYEDCVGAWKRHKFLKEAEKKQKGE